jgi:peptidoglycan/xylan/chitin deacetylase (PgdA/CDA1 family)
MNKETGKLVISLDFELFWGMTDKFTLDEYGSRILGEQTAIPKMLEIFQKYGLHATWGTVGMLAFDTKEELMAALPEKRPHYANKNLSNYDYLARANVGQGEKTDHYHFGASLVRLIQSCPHQEIASHTFSHYYALEDGQDLQTFKADLEAQKATLARFGVTPRSLIFPRNQASDAYARAAGEAGIIVYRGNENHVLYRARPEAEQSLSIRALRLADHYLPISGHHTYALSAVAKSGVPHNIAASRFFRPYMARLRMLEMLRLARIKRSMTYAAKRAEIFHLWWHPHNVGAEQEENFANLEKIAQHFVKLKERYGMESATMRETADLCKQA